MSSPEIKNIPLSPSGKSALGLPPSRAHKRGASRSSRTLGAGCGGRGSVRRARMRAGRMMLTRTVKSCGSDAPMLASSLREEAQATVANVPVQRGEREVSRKTIARGMPGDFRCDRGDYARMLVLFCMRGCGCIERPAFPAPSVFLGETVLQNSGDQRRGNAESYLKFNVIATRWLLAMTASRRAAPPVVIARLDRATQYSRDVEINSRSRCVL